MNANDTLEPKYSLSPAVRAELERAGGLLHPEPARCLLLSADRRALLQNSRHNLRTGKRLAGVDGEVTGVTLIQWLRRDHKIIVRLGTMYCRVATLAPECAAMCLGAMLWAYLEQLAIVENLAARQRRQEDSNT